MFSIEIPDMEECGGCGAVSMFQTASVEPRRLQEA